MYAVIELIERCQPAIKLCLSHEEAMECGADCAVENAVDDDLETRERMIVEAKVREQFTEHSRFSIGDYCVSVQPVEDPSATSPVHYSSPLARIRNAMLAGPDRDRTLLEDEDYDADGLPLDGDIWKEACNDDMLGAWIDYIDNEEEIIAAKREKILSHIDTCIEGSQKTGRWIKGIEALDEYEEGAVWEPYTAEEQERWLNAVCEHLREVKKLL